MKKKYFNLGSKIFVTQNQGGQMQLSTIFVPSIVYFGQFFG
jgi:hypothetical protein